MVCVVIPFIGLSQNGFATFIEAVPAAVPSQVLHIQ